MNTINALDYVDLLFYREWAYRKPHQQLYRAGQNIQSEAGECRIDSLGKLLSNENVVNVSAPHTSEETAAPPPVAAELSLHFMSSCTANFVGHKKDGQVGAERFNGFNSL